MKIGAASTAEITLDSLKPDTRYHYRIHARQTRFSGIGDCCFRFLHDTEAATRSLLLHPGFRFPYHPIPCRPPEDSGRNQFRHTQQKAGISAHAGRQYPDLHIPRGADDRQKIWSVPLPASAPGPGKPTRFDSGLLPSTATGKGKTGGILRRKGAGRGKPRKAHFPNPGQTTYPQGGSPDEDYYGFTWGDALFLVLNVTGYTPRTTLSTPRRASGTTGR